MYKLEDIKPKKYPDEKPSEGNPSDYWAYNGFDFEEYRYSSIRSFGDEWIGVSKHEHISWFIDIPGAPPELKPLAYPENKPEQDGKYWCYNRERDSWYSLRWDRSHSWNSNIDYFIPYRLDQKENEMTKCKIIDDKSADIVTVKNIEENYPVDVDRTDFQKEVIKWLDLQGYDVVKREPELLPCPFCGGECYTWNPAENDWSVACQDCTYNSGCADSESEAIRLHNLIADNALSRKENE